MVGSGDDHRPRRGRGGSAPASLTPQPRGIPALGALGALRQDHPAIIRRAVHHADLDAVRQHRAPFGQHAARVAHRARAIGGGFVPMRRIAQHRAGVAGAQRADDQVMDAVGILQHAERRHPGHGDAGRLRRRRAVAQHQRAIVGVGPGAGDHARADLRARAVSAGDALLDLGFRHHATRDQRGDEAVQQRDAVGAGRGGHGQRASSQCSKISTSSVSPCLPSSNSAGWSKRT